MPNRPPDPALGAHIPGPATTLPTADLGRAGLRVTTLAFGSAAIGQREVDDDTATATVQAALDAGITYVDTAPMYGDGRAEKRVGTVLAGRPRDSFVLSSKVGRLVRPGHPDSAGTGHDWIYDYTRDGILRSLDESLTRIGVDHLDIAYIHDCDGHWADAITYAWPTLDDLRSQGVLRSIGVGMTQAPMPARFVRETSIDVILLAGRYSLIDPEASTSSSRCASRRTCPSSPHRPCTAVSSRVDRTRPTTTGRSTPRRRPRWTASAPSARPTTCRLPRPDCSSCSHTRR